MPRGGSGRLGVDDKGLEVTFADNSDRMPDALHIFGLSVLAAFCVPSEDCQVLIADNQMRCRLGDTGLYGHSDFGREFSGLASRHAQRSRKDHHGTGQYTGRIAVHGDCSSITLSGDGLDQFLKGNS